MFLATRGDEAHPCRFSMSPAWRAWNRWVAHLELPEEDLVVVQLPSGSGHGKLAAAALGGLEEQRAAAGCDVEDVTVTVVAPSPQSALLRLSIEARWPPQWAHAVTDIIPLPEHVSGGGTSTSVRPRSGTPLSRLREGIALQMGLRLDVTAGGATDVMASSTAKPVQPASQSRLTPSQAAMAPPSLLLIDRSRAAHEPCTGPLAMVA